jgi:hypothetical protein
MIAIKTENLSKDYAIGFWRPRPMSFRSFRYYAKKYNLK